VDAQEFGFQCDVVKVALKQQLDDIGSLPSPANYYRGGFG
jgi:hypothetical protein